MDSLRAAIDALWIACLRDPYAKRTWQEQVEASSSPICQLYPVRPTSCRCQKVNGGAKSAEYSLPEAQTRHIGEQEIHWMIGLAQKRRQWQANSDCAMNL